MNKLRTLLIWGLLAAVTHVMGSTVTVNPIQIQAGQSTYLIINLNNTETNLTAYQMSLYLPEGVTVKKTNGEYEYTLNADRQNSKFFPAVTDAADGSILIAVFSYPKSSIAGTSGELIRLPIDVASSVTTSLQGSIKNIGFSDVDKQMYDLPDVNFTMTLGGDTTPFSNNKQYLIHTRDKIRGTLGVFNNHLASTNPIATGPYVCRPIVLDKNNPLITSVDQLTSPYTEPTEGSLAAMIDGDKDTFWHSIWSDGDVEAGTHYFQVKITNPANIDVAFQVTRRQTEDNHITEWGVYGTNNTNATKANCTKLADIETPYTTWGETRVSNIFSTGGYKYLRFYIERTTKSNVGHLAEFQLYPATFDEAHGDASPFAIIQKDGGYYLYSVLDKAFITPENDGDESTDPLLPSDNKMNIYKRDNHFVFDFVETGYTINVNYEPGIKISDWGTLTDLFDDGNLFTIEEVGDFDPTEALAKFDMQTFTVTYEVRYNSKVVATATEEVISGSALPPVPASLDNGFVTLTKTGTHPTTVTGDVTVRYNATWKGPFEFTKDEGSAKWYNMHIRSGWYVGKQDTEPYYPVQADEVMLRTPAYQWAFDGDPYHVKVYNRTTGLAETLTKDGDNAVMRSGDYTWDLLPNSDGFLLCVTGTENSCINQFGGPNGPLQFWTDSNSLTDDGSTFRVVEVVTGTENKEEQTLSLTTLPAMTYGDAAYTLPATTAENLTLTWTSSNTAVATISGNVLTIMGAGTTTVTATQAGNDQYLPFTKQYTLDVAKAALTITADNKSKLQGEANPELTVTYSGFVNGDDASVLTTQPTVTTTATASSPIGSYPITVSGAAAANYNITYVGGTLTIVDETALNNTLAALDAKGFVGSKTTLAIALTNANEVRLCQFDLHLPEGVTVALNTNNKLDVTLTDRASTHKLRSQQLANGDYRFVVTPDDNESFLGNEGTLMNIVLDIAEDADAGNRIIRVLNIELSLPEGNDLKVVNPADAESILTISSYKPGDANGDNKVTVTDVGYVINYILEQVPSVFIFDAADMTHDGKITVTDVGYIINIILSDDGGSRAKRKASAQHMQLEGVATLAQAGTEHRLYVDAENCIGFQMDIMLPQGVGLTAASLDAMSCADHALAFHQVAENKYRILCYSPTNSTLNRAADALLSLTTTAATDGMTVTDILFTTASLDEVTFVIGDDATGIASMGTDGKDAMYDLLGRRVDSNRLHKGIYLSKGKKSVKK